MTDASATMKSEAAEMQGQPRGAILRSTVIGLTAFLTVVDLFATQAILPSLTRHYNVTPAAMGFAVNASTMGMAVAGLVVGFLSAHIDRRRGILLSLVVLAIPTTLLAVAPNLAVFTVLRIMQGLCMASAFALTLAYLGEQCSSMDAGGAFAAYITGNVASNLIGRLVSAALVDTLGLASNFYFFALLTSPERCWCTSPSSRCRRCLRCRCRKSRSRRRSRTGVTRRCARPMASASASCSPSSGRSLT
jgi:predicted MFS family arabinose efflux permease